MILKKHGDVPLENHTTVEGLLEERDSWQKVKNCEEDFRHEATVNRRAQHLSRAG
jgi:hypothetical protein